MKTSESIINISKALCEAQKNISHAHKDSKNPHFKNDYASLESVIDASKKPLLDQGVFVVQSLEDGLLTTRLQHISGEYFESALTMILSRNDMQGLGSSATYSRRYSLAAMLNISQADDDGNAASQPQKQSAPITSKPASKAVGVLTGDSFSDYIINAGPKNKMTGTKLMDHDPAFLLKTVESSDAWHKANNKVPHKNTKEFSDMVTAYLKHIDFLPF